MSTFHKAIHLLVIDLESMGTKPGYVITEIGGTLFTSKHREVGHYDFHESLDYTRSKAAGFKVSSQTIGWWAEQLALPPASRKDYERFFAEKWRSTSSIKGTIVDFALFYHAIVAALPPGDKLYLVGNDIDFDKSILEHYFSATSTTIPWHHRDWISLPTVVWLVELLTGVNIKESIRSSWQTTHEALDDAKQEAAMLNLAFELLATMQHNVPDANVPEGYVK
jgi:hypothetical protein